MSLRTRLLLLAASAVAVAVLCASAVTYVVTAHQLQGQLDSSLKARATRIAQGDPRGLQDNIGRGPPASPFRNGNDELFQVVGSDGSTAHPPDQRALPVNSADLAVATGGRSSILRSVDVGGTHLRVITVPTDNGIALQFARPLTDVDNTLGQLRLDLALIGLGGIALAAALGFFVARTSLRPVKKLTRAAEHVTETEDLTATIEVDRNDELGRLAESFNAMLTALAASRDEQRQLVSDASHELRTPLTALRTNIEVLARQPQMPAGEREQLLADVTEQLAEFGTLVGDLVELARDDGPGREEEWVDVRLDDLVRRAVERSRRHSSGIRFETSYEPSVVHGETELISRALANVLDNACKWSPAGSVIEVSSRDGEVVVRDHGPGIDPADLPRIFDRFYRAPAARSMPGSGLGLSIVARVMQSHHGVAIAETAADGGARFRLQFPTATAENGPPVAGDPHGEPDPVPLPSV
jgi:two-component system sensor histidine kinase MprB